MGQYFRFSYNQKEVEKPDECHECGCKRILSASYGDLPINRVNRKSNFSHRSVWMCNDCGEVFGMVKELSRDHYIKPFSTDYGEKYEHIRKG